MAELNVVKRLREIQRKVEELSQKQVVVGAISGEVREDGLTNAELLAIHEFGSVTQGIPERPVLRIAIAKNINVIEKTLSEEVSKCLHGGQSVNRAYGNVGSVVMNAVTDVFGSNELEPLKEKTIKYREHGGDKPLFDNGDLKNSISFEVRNRE